MSQSKEKKKKFEYTVVETEIVLMEKLKKGEIQVKKPLTKHLSRYKADFYNIIYIFYDGEKIVKNRFQCSRCEKLFNVDRNVDGTNELKRHADDCLLKQTNSSSRNSYRLSHDDLAKVFSKVCEISSIIGPVSAEDICKLLPEQFCSEDM